MRGDNGEPGAAGADGDPGPAGPAGPPGKKVIFLQITYRKIPKISPPNLEYKVKLSKNGKFTSK